MPLRPLADDSPPAWLPRSPAGAIPSHSHDDPWPIRLTRSPCRRNIDARRRARAVAGRVAVWPLAWRCGRSPGAAAGLVTEPPRAAEGLSPRAALFGSPALQRAARGSATFPRALAFLKRHGHLKRGVKADTMKEGKRESGRFRSATESTITSPQSDQSAFSSFPLSPFPLLDMKALQLTNRLCVSEYRRGFRLDRLPGRPKEPR
jgi:hypothetical protein